MRAFFLMALLLPAPALAEQILASSTILSVTVYPLGAEVQREVRFKAPAGSHDLLITDLPLNTMPELLRLGASDGLTLGAHSLRTDRLPPRDALTSPALAAAKAEVELWEAKERDALAEIAAIDIQVEAAEAQAAFLSATRAEGPALTPEAIKALAGMIGAEVLAAKQAALAARAGLPAAQKALVTVQEALNKAREAEAAVLTGAENYAALSVAITANADADYLLSLRHFIQDASWSPVYDINLTRAEGSVTLQRSVLVSQYSGEDWQDVELTLSTAQPSAQSTPSSLWPELRQVVDPAKEADVYARAVADEAVLEAPQIVASAGMETALAGYQGDTVVYRYPSTVDVASGVENLRLALDEKTFPAVAYAQAVPRFDKTAFVMARFTNDSPELLLPGQVTVLREGVLVGGVYLEPMAPGAETELAFGAIEGLRLKRDMPNRVEGDRGILSTSTQREEIAVLQVENLTNDAWPVRLLDQVPYSEQEDLEITFAADPAPSETDVKGQRGILAWDFDLAAGEKKSVTLTHALRWPEGMELR
jgi:uncharacterized protein (TIGR02231 family)